MTQRCDCIGPPWPEMRRLQVGGLSRWFVCPECRVIKEQVFEGAIIIGTMWYKDWSELTQLVQSQAQNALETHREPEQLALFEEDRVEAHQW